MSDVVHTRQGAVRGERLADGDVVAFRGIPYAAPPVGDLRWRPPQPPAAWSGVREARTFGPIPIQQVSAVAGMFPKGEVTQDEDCLSLNVWTSAPGAGAARPVIVWFHLGAFQFGWGSAPQYHGEAWARAGAVFVTFNFRLAKLGFLTHPDLATEDPDGVCGNYGFLDQIAALEWVRDNISAFGGDPGCVTLFGVSSGASSVSLLMASPAARGLFHRAIAESGGSFGPAGESTGVGDRWQTLPAALRSGATWAEATGAGSLRALRAMSADAIREVSYPTASRGIFDASRPVLDGRTLVASSRAVFEAGKQALVPLLVGSAANEGLATVNFAPDRATFLREAEQDHGDNLEAFLRLYPPGDDAESVRVGLRANGHRLFSWQNWIWANLHAQAGSAVYYYRFEQAPPAPADASGRSPGAFHGASVFYSFDRLHLRPDWAWSPADREVSATMLAAWVAFARTGRPEAPGLPAWPTFDPNQPRAMAIQTEMRLQEVPEREYLAFWDRFYAADRPAR